MGAQHLLFGKYVYWHDAKPQKVSERFCELWGPPLAADAQHTETQCSYQRPVNSVVSLSPFLLRVKNDVSTEASEESHGVTEPSFFQGM